MAWGGIIYIYDYRFRNSRNNKVSTSTIWEAAELVLLTGGIYDARRLDGFVWHDTHTKYHEDWYRRSGKINVLSQQFKRLYC
jgi:hypothetical protein